MSHVQAVTPSCSDRCIGHSRGWSGLTQGSGSDEYATDYGRIPSSPSFPSSCLPPFQSVEPPIGSLPDIVGFAERLNGKVSSGGQRMRHLPAALSSKMKAGGWVCSQLLFEERENSRFLQTLFRSLSYNVSVIRSSFRGFVKTLAQKIIFKCHHTLVILRIPTRIRQVKGDDMVPNNSDQLFKISYLIIIKHHVES